MMESPWLAIANDNNWFPFFLLIGARQCWWFRLRATLGLNNPLWSDVSMNCQDKLLLNLPFGMPSVTLLLHIWHANGSHRQPRMLMATFSIWCLNYSTTVLMAPAIYSLWFTTFNCLLLDDSRYGKIWII